MTTIARIKAACLRHLPTQYLVPIALLLAVSFGALFALLFHLTSVQDRMEREREIEVVRNSVDHAKQRAEFDIADYAKWDDAVIHLVLRFDPVWAGDNLGPYLGREQGNDYVLVFDGADRPLYAYHRGQLREDLDVTRELGPAFAASLALARERAASAAPVVTGYTKVGSAVYVYSVTSVRPLTGKVVLPSGRTTLMAIVRRVDGPFFHELSRDPSSPPLHMTHEPHAGELNVPIRTEAGQAIANLAWKPNVPGTALRKGIWPAFLGAVLLSLLIAGLILQRGRKALEALRLSESRAKHHAQHDLLTGLPNRRALHEQLQVQIDCNADATLLYLDLDGFKETNDVYGHGAGDELLRAAASRLHDILPEDCVLARVGGDEFAIVAPGPAAGKQLAKNVLKAFSAPFTVGRFRVSLGVSVGIATNSARCDADELVRRADAAMYVAKSQGKHCFELYCPEIDAGRDVRRELEQDLQAAIERDEIQVVYQPIVAAGSQETLCVEALARWDHPRHGPIDPERFIPLAEESGLIVPLGHAVLARACRDAREWGVNLAVNLSPAQFWDRRLATAIEQVLQETGFPAERLELEITEGYLLRRPEAAARVLARLKSVGVRIALDDFGTGFASVGYLQKLGFDSIKIDRSFVAEAVTSPKAADLARAIVGIGNALHLPVTAEGVETLEQAALMTSAGCVRLQGWLFGRPVSCSAASSLIETKLKLAG